MYWTTLKKATENSGKWSDIVQFGRKRELSCSMFYTLIEHAISTNNSARYIQTLLEVQLMQYMKSAEMYVKCSVIFMDYLGLRIFSML